MCYQYYDVLPCYPVSGTASVQIKAAHVEVNKEKEKIKPGMINFLEKFYMPEAYKNLTEKSHVYQCVEKAGKEFMFYPHKINIRTIVP